MLPIESYFLVDEIIEKQDCGNTHQIFWSHTEVDLCYFS